ncbi:MAG TPA: M13 family metallopeptidase [Steroidobacteraceae bacterium]|nr:M13 family metallopeptidase [Steroidobacteraceae bacterium]
MRASIRTIGGLLISAALASTTTAGEATTLPLSGIELQYVDDSVRPQDDPYQYLNGKWLAGTRIPDDKPSYGAFDKVYDESQEQLRVLVDAVADDHGAAANSDTGRIRDLHHSFMDEKRLETLGMRPLAQELAGITSLKSRQELPSLLAHLQRIGVTTPFSPSVHLDNRDATRYVYDLGQDGLGLPDRDYYLRDDDTTLKKIREQYQAHIEHTLTLAGDRNAAGEARRIIALETRLAQAQWTKVENRDPVKTYNKVELSQLPALAGGFDWRRYLAAAGVDGKIDYVIVGQPSYLTAMSQALQDVPLADWQTYLRWHLISAMSPYLSKAFVDERFAFYGTVLRGVPQNRPRWKRGLSLINGEIGEALGQLYVAKYFPPERLARAQSLVQHMLTAYHQDIETLDWMGEDTRREALQKLGKIAVKIGYPSHWRDYSSLRIRPDDLIGNVIRANEFEFLRNVNKLGRPVDRTEWDMTPQTVNAYYNPEMNEIVFPAAILQPPFFNASADEAVNYGAIGSVIGHEISHGFDDQGSQYDGDGNLRDWWTAEDHRRFAERTRALVAEYSAFEPVPGYHLNGELTLGENIADNAGIAVSYKAYRLSLAGKAAAVIDNLSGEQRFYLGFTQCWRSKTRDNFAIELIKSDPHSPSVDRVLGTLVNQPGFYEAFDVKPGDRMYRSPQQRVLLW